MDKATAFIPPNGDAMLREATTALDPTMRIAITFPLLIIGARRASQLRRWHDLGQRLASGQVNHS